MARYKVQQQDWKHWPKVLVVEQWNEYGLAIGRYVPDKGTCRIIEAELDDEGYKLLTIEPYPDATSKDEWYGIMGVCSECGEYVPKMNYCPECGRKVV